MNGSIETIEFPLYGDLFGSTETVPEFPVPDYTEDEIDNLLRAAGFCVAQDSVPDVKGVEDFEQVLDMISQLPLPYEDLDMDLMPSSKGKLAGRSGTSGRNIEAGSKKRPASDVENQPRNLRVKRPKIAAHHIVSATKRVVGVPFHVANLTKKRLTAGRPGLGQSETGVGCQKKYKGFLRSAKTLQKLHWGAFPQSVQA